MNCEWQHSPRYYMVAKSLVICRAHLEWRSSRSLSDTASWHSLCAVATNSHITKLRYREDSVVYHYVASAYHGTMHFKRAQIKCIQLDDLTINLPLSTRLSIGKGRKSNWGKA